MARDRADGEAAALCERFSAVFGRRPTLLARAPGRVNLIGEHTDYNEGFVLPLAIEREARLAAAPRDDRRIRLVAQDIGRETAFDLGSPAPSAAEPWSNYVRGVAAGLVEAGYSVRGLDALIQGDVPMGAGLASSAALEMAALLALAAAGGFDVPAREAARIGQQAEHAFAGTRCGIMDQLTVLAGRADHALFMDCRDLRIEPVPLPARAAILIADTGVRRRLPSSAYNERRAECEAAARRLGVRALRDATREALAAASLEETLARRARHVVEENGRVIEAVAALRAEDLGRVGELMNASHESLRDLYQVSGPELDLLVALLRKLPGCRGARMTGAGFGGSAVALLDETPSASAREEVARAYRALSGRAPALFLTRAAGGARVLHLE